MREDFAAISALSAALQAVALRNAPAASDFLDAQKVTKKAPGGKFRMSADALIFTHPLEPPFYGGRQLGFLGGRRKGAGSSADWFPFYDRCRFGSGNLWVLLLLVERAPFAWVGLKCGSGNRRAGEDTCSCGVSGSAFVLSSGPDTFTARVPGGPVCRPYGENRTRSVGSGMPGAAAESHLS